MEEGPEHRQINKVTTRELDDAFNRLKNGKAARPGTKLVKYRVFNKGLEGQNIPDNWNVGYISSIYKKHDKRMCYKLKKNKCCQLSGEVERPNSKRKNRIKIRRHARTKSISFRIIVHR